MIEPEVEIFLAEQIKPGNASKSGGQFCFQLTGGSVGLDHRGWQAVTHGALATDLLIAVGKGWLLASTKTERTRLGCKMQSLRGGRDVPSQAAYRCPSGAVAVGDGTQSVHRLWPVPLRPEPRWRINGISGSG